VIDDPYIIRLIGGVKGIERYPELRAHIGKYVTRYEPAAARKGEQWIWTSDDPMEAVGFEDPTKLHAFYSEAIGTRPWDGRPDRPITAFHVQTALRSVFLKRRERV
jgi:hypothetical protein